MQTRMELEEARELPDVRERQQPSVSAQDAEPYCTNCGSDHLRYLEAYANGDEYECRECGQVAIW